MNPAETLTLICCAWILFMLGFFTACLLAAAKRGDRKVKGTRENPFDNIQDAFDACEPGDSVRGPGKIFWVDNPKARLDFYEIDEEGNDDQQPG